MSGAFPERLGSLLSIILVATAVPLAAQSLPEPTGHHLVGTTTYHWVDAHRPERATSDPDDMRQVMAQLWYPAAPLPSPVYARYFPRIDDVRAALRTHVDEMPRRLAEDMAVHGTVQTHALLEPPVDEAAAAPRYPVLVVSPGGNVSRHWHSALAEEFASRGYVVAVVSHAYNGWDVFPAGGFLKSIDWGLNDDDEAAARAADDSLASYLAADVALVLDRLAELDAGDRGSRFSGRIDLDRVAIIGHSRGGSTVARSCSTDARIDACIVFDNIGPPLELDTGLRKPQLVLRSAAWGEARVARLHDFLRRNPVGAVDVAIEGAAHMSFTDLPIVDPAHFESAIDALRAHTVVVELTTAFLNRNLRGDESASVEATAAALPEARVVPVGTGE